MNVINDTIVMVLDKTVSCSNTVDGLLIRTLALIGLISVGMSFSKGVFLGIGYPIAYAIGFVKWVYQVIRR